MKANEDLKEKALFAFEMLSQQFKQHLENERFAPLEMKYTMADFKNKKDYELKLTLKEVKK